MASVIIKRGSIVLIRYPFTDLTGTKVRPALVLTPDQFLPLLEDVLCLFISSSIPETALSTDLILNPDSPSFENTEHPVDRRFLYAGGSEPIDP